MAAKKAASQPKITEFDLLPGRIIARKYEVLKKLGEGWEGEVYKVRERSTGIVRAAKVFFPHRNVRNKTSKMYARKLHKLRDCPLLIHYHTDEQWVYRRTPVAVFISEFVEGELLSEFIKRFPHERMQPFQALHLLHALAKGIEQIHQHHEYHGDLHWGNIMVQHFGLEFELKAIDLFHWGDSKKDNRDEDLCNLIRIFYDCLGGSRYYRIQPPEVKHICCGLKRSLIFKRFRTVRQLRKHLEKMEWQL